MANLQKDNGQEKERVKPVSVLDKKRQYILGELSEIMDQTRVNYNPFLMDELQRRLEIVVQNFNEELKFLIKGSFENWKIKDSQLRDLMNNLDSEQIPKPPMKKEKSADISTPNFIKAVKFGPIRHK